MANPGYSLTLSFGGSNHFQGRQAVPFQTNQGSLGFAVTWELRYLGQGGQKPS